MKKKWNYPRKTFDEKLSKIKGNKENNKNIRWIIEDKNKMNGFVEDKKISINSYNYEINIKE